MPYNLETKLKHAMRGLAQSVIVVTTAYEGERHAMVVTAVCPVSMDPPSMLVCITRTASAYATLSKGGFASTCWRRSRGFGTVLQRASQASRFDSGIFATTRMVCPM